MAFININKVTIENADGVKGAMSNTMLLFASLIYDDVDTKEYGKALEKLEMLKCSIMNLEYVLRKT